MRKTLYLVTGTTDHLGVRVARQLAAEDKDVRVLVPSGKTTADCLPPQVGVFAGDVADAVALQPFFAAEEDSELIAIHCDAIVTVSDHFSERVYEINVDGTRNVIEMCIERKARKLVYVSSIAAMPELPKGRRIVEVDRYEPCLVGGFYGKTEAEACRLVLDAVRERGLDASIICSGGIVGPGDYSYGPVASVIIDYINGNLPVGVAGTLNFADVRDLAAGVVACCERGRSGESYIMANESVPVRRIFRLISAASGAREIKVMLPIGVAEILAALAELASRLRGKPARLTRNLVHALARNNDFSSDKAKRELGYRQRPLAQTIADTVAWLMLEGKV
jgi:dihydroflavonol-4-reductase